MGIGIMIVLILGILVFGVLGIIVWESMSRAGGAVTNPFAGMGTGVGKILPWVVGVVLAIILYNTVGLPNMKNTNIDIGFWFALLAIAGLAVASLFFGKGGKAGSLAVWVIVAGIFALLIFGDNMPEVRNAIKEGATSAVLEDKQKIVTQRMSAVQQPQVVQAEVSWVNKSPDGTLPVGEWSPWINVGVGCKLDFFLNEEMKAEWLDYNNKPHDLVVGQHLSNVMSIRFKSVVPGKTRYPYRLTC